MAIIVGVRISFFRFNFWSESGLFQTHVFLGYQAAFRLNIAESQGFTCMDLSHSERVTKKPSGLGQEATKPTLFDKSFII
jgi:uncharacterized membrane protein YobD (UPF0266 family)